MLDDVIGRRKQVECADKRSESDSLDAVNDDSLEEAFHACATESY